MGMIRDSFVIFNDWDDAIRQAPEETQLELYHALMDYAKTGEKPQNLSWQANMFLSAISKGIESTISRYYASVTNGKKGGRPKKEPSTKNDNPTKPKKTQQNLDEPTQNLNVNVNDNVNDFDNVDLEENTLSSVKEDEPSSPSTRTQKHKYGLYKNVLLTEDEFDRLMSEEDGPAAIDYFSEYREMRGYKCKNDNLAIRKWAFSGVKEQRQREARLNKQEQPRAGNESPMEQLSRVIGGK